MTRNAVAIAAVLALPLLSYASDAAVAAPAGHARACFALSQLESTRPDGDSRIYARVGLHDVYRLDLAFSCPTLLSQNGIILEPAGSGDVICTALDLDLKARDIGGGASACMIKSITRLTPEEAAALPPKVKP